MSKMRRRRVDEPPPGNPDLVAMSRDHLLYEIQMMHRLEVECGKYKGTGLGSAIVESFGIHARNLYYFFFAAQQKPNDTTVAADDAIAEDYFPEGAKWRSLCANLEVDPILKCIPMRTGKHLAHLTYARLGVSAQDKTWDFVKICDAFVPLIRAWVEHVEGKYIEGWPQDAKTQQRFL